jgi:hypothetical protein
LEFRRPPLWAIARGSEYHLCVTNVGSPTFSRNGQENSMLGSALAASLYEVSLHERVVMNPGGNGVI